MAFITTADWSDDRIARLTFLWNQGTTLKTIAEEFRIQIPAIEAQTRNLKLLAQPVFRPETVTLRADMRYTDGCSWPLEKNGAFHRFCDDKAKIGKPYCDAHASKAYLKRKPSTARRLTALKA
jgi:hypothetical protein